MNDGRCCCRGSWTGFDEKAYKFDEFLNFSDFRRNFLSVFNVLIIEQQIVDVLFCFCFLDNPGVC